MSLLLFGLRLAFLVVAVFFAAGLFGYLLLFYERAAQDAVRGERRKITRESLRRFVGAWARESALHVVMAGFWLSGVLPRGKLRTGAWLPQPGESRPGRPVLLVPGYAMNRGTLRLLATRIEETGRPALAISLPYWKTMEELAALVGEAASELKRATGSDKIDVVAHSRGGVNARWWIQKLGGAADVERFVSLGSAHAGTKMAAFGIGPCILDQFPGSRMMRELAAAPLHPDVEWFAINGGEDCMMLPPGCDELPPPGRNMRVDGLGHTALLFSAKAWSYVRLALLRSEEEAIAADIHDDETTDEAALRTLAQMTR